VPSSTHEGGDPSLNELLVYAALLVCALALKDRAHRPGWFWWPITEDWWWWALVVLTSGFVALGLLLRVLELFVDEEARV
jgi:drug/metabolite transporter (DMT)-like permease